MLGWQQDMEWMLCWSAGRAKSGEAAATAEISVLLKERVHILLHKMSEYQRTNVMIDDLSYITKQQGREKWCSKCSCSKDIDINNTLNILW